LLLLWSPVTDYCFKWCRVMMVIFNTCFGSIICHIGKFYFKDFLNCYFKVFGDKCMKIITTGHIFILNYQGFQNNQANSYEFFLPWDMSSNWSSKYQEILNYRLPNQPGFTVLCTSLTTTYTLKCVCVQNVGYQKKMYGKFSLQNCTVAQLCQQPRGRSVSVLLEFLRFLPVTVHSLFSLFPFLDQGPVAGCLR
jgi:hypothetical protein